MMERTQIFDLMGELKLFGMRSAYDPLASLCARLRAHKLLLSRPAPVRPAFSAARSGKSAAPKRRDRRLWLGCPGYSSMRALRLLR